MPYQIKRIVNEKKKKIISISFNYYIFNNNKTYYYIFYLIFNRHIGHNRISIIPEVISYLVTLEVLYV